MSENTTKGREEVYNSLLILERVYERKPGSFQLQVFFNAKSNEIVDLFGEGLPKEKSGLTNLLTKIDPNNLSKYNKLAERK